MELLNWKIDTRIMTPERMVYEGEVEFVVLPAFDGEVGFLANHAPFISVLGAGEVRLKTRNSTEYLFLEGGVVEIHENRLIVLAEKATREDELVVSDIQQDIDENRIQAAQTQHFSQEYLAIQAHTERLKLKLKVAKKI